MLEKLAVLLVIALVLFCISCWFYARHRRRWIKPLQDKYQEVVRLGADPNSPEMLFIANLINQSAQYIGIWRFDLEWVTTREAWFRLARQEVLHPRQEPSGGQTLTNGQQ